MDGCNEARDRAGVEPSINGKMINFELMWRRAKKQNGLLAWRFENKEN